MKKGTYTTFAILAVLVIFALPAQAYRGHGGHFNLWLGPVWGPVYPYPYPYPAYVSPPVVIRQEPEIHYLTPPSPEQHYWYYCPNPKGYYPYVKECPDGWTRVAPRPPDMKD